MSPPKEELLSLELPCDFGAPGLARAHLEGLDWLGWVLGDVLLISTELINCAVLRCGASSDHVLRVSGWLTDGIIHLEVNCPTEPRQGATDEDGATSDEDWTHMIIEQLAARWGERDTSGYAIWADLEVPELPVHPLPDQ